MDLTFQDQVVLCLTIWRENRAGGQPGMQSITNVILNRCAKNGSDPTTECLKKWQFSSISAPGDPQIDLGPNMTIPADWQSWQTAMNIVVQAALGNLPDLTGGATLYYAPKVIQTTATIDAGGETIPFPADWNASAVAYTTTIQNQAFFREV